MTNKRGTPNGEKGEYKQIFYRNIRSPEKYTEAKVNESDYMITPVWQELRQACLKRDGYRCAQCGSAINLQVHHIHYPDVWGEESLDDLKTFCDDCHRKLHKERPQEGT